MPRFATYRYAGPDGEGIAGLPGGTGAVIGSEYCTHLLPAAHSLLDAISAARERGIPLLLLSPYFRDEEIKAFVGLLRAIPDDADFEVAINDWGALLAVRTLFPRLRLSVGRLLSGQKRCPRIGTSERLTPAGRAWHGEGLFSSGQVRNYLRSGFGVSGFHLDDVAWGRDAVTRVAGGGDEGVALFIHAPWAIVTVSDVCPWIGGRSSSAVRSCPRDCRNGMVRLREPSMGQELIQRGKARFGTVSPAPGIRDSVDAAGCRIVLYGDVP